MTSSLLWPSATRQEKTWRIMGNSFTNARVRDCAASVWEPTIPIASACSDKMGVVFVGLLTCRASRVWRWGRRGGV
ncbi:hypothetical protein GCM10009726_21740 [Nocardioides furvisabuli]|uniref:Uncharacterized protein n=1 Tax=Nocardioides furvisabuli TaxID=375542 RepID=A0ABP5IYJ3_9ACTN